MPLPTLAYRLIGRFSVTRFDQVVHPFLYRWSGRRSCKPRTVALFAFPIAEPPGSWAVVGSRGGSKKIPAWYGNLAAVPSATLQVRGRTLDVRAREVFGDEYEAIFERAAATFPGYRLYRAESPLHIPIVVLEPTTSVEGPSAGPR